MNCRCESVDHEFSRENSPKSERIEEENMYLSTIAPLVADRLFGSRDCFLLEAYQYITDGRPSSMSDLAKLCKGGYDWNDIAKAVRVYVELRAHEQLPRVIKQLMSDLARRTHDTYKPGAVVGLLQGIGNLESESTENQPDFPGLDMVPRFLGLAVKHLQKQEYHAQFDQWGPEVGKTLNIYLRGPRHSVKAHTERVRQSLQMFQQLGYVREMHSDGECQSLGWVLFRKLQFALFQALEPEHQTDALRFLAKQ